MPKRKASDSASQGMSKKVTTTLHPTMTQFDSVIVQKLSANEEDDRRQHLLAEINVAVADAKSVDDDETCAVCMEKLTLGRRGTPEETVELRVCSHRIHFACLRDYVSAGSPPRCPLCQTFFAPPKGPMPCGSRMTATLSPGALPGHESTSSRTISIHYDIPSGTQGNGHPHPGRHYSGTSRTAYLPDNEEGRRVYYLLRLAFQHRLTFAVGDSVVWNNIHHKTYTHGGSDSFGYPDPTYLKRVTMELAAAGITDSMLTAEQRRGIANGFQH